MSILKRWWHRLWCLHSWVEIGIVDIVYGRGYLRKYRCNRCGKKIKRFNEPVSFVE